MLRTGELYVFMCEVWKITQVCIQRTVKSLSTWLSHLASGSYCGHWTLALLFALPKMWGKKQQNLRCYTRSRARNSAGLLSPPPYPQHTFSFSSLLNVSVCLRLLSMSPTEVPHHIHGSLAKKVVCRCKLSACRLMLVSWRNSPVTFSILLTSGMSSHPDNKEDASPGRDPQGTALHTDIETAIWCQTICPSGKAARFLPVWATVREGTLSVRMDLCLWDTSELHVLVPKLPCRLSAPESPSTV